MNTRYEQACKLFDKYNQRDPKSVRYRGQDIPENVLYAQRMHDKLMSYQPGASEHLQLAARCQHIGRWEIPRNTYEMNRRGYLQWRSQLKIHHANIASEMMKQVGYSEEIISKVKDLLMKKQLKQNPETQILEDVICLVFLEHYFDDFSRKHDDEKLINILKKTIGKMSERGIQESLELPLSKKAKSLIAAAVT